MQRKLGLNFSDIAADSKAVATKRCRSALDFESRRKAEVIIESILQSSDASHIVTRPICSEAGCREPFMTAVLDTRAYALSGGGSLGEFRERVVSIDR